MKTKRVPQEVEPKESHGCETRAQLEGDTAGLRSKRKKAIDKKNFLVASKVKQSLNKKEQRRQYSPTTIELATQLREAKEKQDMAIAIKTSSKLMSTIR